VRVPLRCIGYIDSVRSFLQHSASLGRSTKRSGSSMALVDDYCRRNAYVAQRRNVITSTTTQQSESNALGARHRSWEHRPCVYAALIAFDPPPANNQYAISTSNQFQSIKTTTTTGYAATTRCRTANALTVIFVYFPRNTNSHCLNTICE